MKSRARTQLGGGRARIGRGATPRGTLAALSALVFLAIPSAGAVQPQEAVGARSAASAGASQPAVARLAHLVGNWRAEIEMQRPDGASLLSAGRSNVRFGPGERSLLVDFEATSGPMSGFALHQIITWDGAGERFWLIWVDSFNAGATVVPGRHQEGSYLFDRQVGQGDSLQHLRSVYTAIEPTSFRAESFVSGDGKSWTPSLTLRYSRQSSAPESTEVPP